jgi:cytochrome c oxidase assembly protein subunit 15
MRLVLRSLTVKAIGTAEPARADRGVGILAVGFGTTVAMWAIGYAGRLPAVLLPSQLMLALLLVCVLAGGGVLGRQTGLGWRHGGAAGLVSGMLNLLVLGSFLSGSGTNRLVPSALIWIPGSILVAAVLAAVGAEIGARGFRRESPYSEWQAAFSRVNIAAALLLLAVGGLVTSTGTGLAVVDWPNSFGYNMFLYPFSRMTGGIYYEHAHRLFGALVGLTTASLAVLLQLREPRTWVRRLGWLALALVIVQGIMGGLRVTGGFTLATSPEATRPNLLLAMAHGILGQVFFALLVAIGAVTSPGWRNRPIRADRAAARGDALLGGMLIAVILAQLTLGATQRHFTLLLFPHILLGVTVVAPLALHLGFRTWGGGGEGRPVARRLGLVLAGVVGLQVLLGFLAYAATASGAGSASPPAFEVLLTTSHQWVGAVLLATAVLVFCWSFCPSSARPDVVSS